MSTVIEKNSDEPAAANATNKLKLDPAPLIRREVTDDQICILTFDRPDSAANIFDRDTLLELDVHLAAIEQDRNLRGVVVTSAKDNIFIAGADLNSLAKTDDAAHLSNLIRLGQDTFNRLANLPIPTVAAIHGACVGGGYEICLACDMRVATPDKATKIGLPETQLGILPAWGGSTRLPRLIGLPAALDIILAGKTVVAPKAAKLSMIDGVVPHEILQETAEQWIVSGKKLPRGKRRLAPTKMGLFNSGLIAGIIERRVRPDIEKRTRGHYPAITKALEVVVNGLGVSEANSMEMEHNAIMELAKTPAAGNLVQVFFLQERAKKIRMLKDAKTPPITKAAVIGAGVMGSGIVQWLSSRDCQVAMRDINAAAVAHGMANIGKLYQAGVERRKFTAIEARQGIDRVRPMVELYPMKQIDLVIEAAVERLDLKVDLFHQLEGRIRDDAILATNTSALSITTIAQGLLVPERVVGIHFFNPVHRMQLVEVIRGEKTDPEVLQRSVKFVQRIGKMPVVVKDSPGFIVNRILMPYMIEAARLFELGADVKAIDDAMLDFGMPMGPLRLADEVGVDVALHVSETLAKPFAKYLVVPKVLSQLVEKKWLGKKTGKGFYLHQGKTCQPNEADIRFMRDDKAANAALGKLQSRMVLLMVNEAARCLEESLVEGPEDIDFAMIMGTGFAPFRGGPLRFANQFGIQRVVDDMNRLVEGGERHFLPCELLEEMASGNKTFYAKQ
jgi:3-hydroxyacyl-CoA dehydrogenase / enoyl-CoA hydratase / 3-hydroxybutyryl-CoA epimerase